MTMPAFISALDFLSPEEIRETSFLKSLKMVLREHVHERMTAKGLTQNQVAKDLGWEPASFSRALNPDRHINTKSMFLILDRLGYEWRFDCVAIQPTIEGVILDSVTPAIQQSSTAILFGNTEDFAATFEPSQSKYDFQLPAYEMNT
jgi:transcriptional regulator with XRE-family HTH domain